MNSSVPVAFDPLATQAKQTPMDQARRRVYFLLKLMVFFYPRPDEEEMDQLREKAALWKADDDRRWAIEFIDHEPATAFARTTEFVGEQFKGLSKAEREQFLDDIWHADLAPRGYVTEMQAMALLKMAQGWGLQERLLKLLGR